MRTMSWQVRRLEGEISTAYELLALGGVGSRVTACKFHCIIDWRCGYIYGPSLSVDIVEVKLSVTSLWLVLFVSSLFT